MALKHKKNRLRGLGDVVAAATKAIGIKPCRGCEKRQEKLNAWLPFGGDDRGTPEYFTAAQRTQDTLSLIPRLPKNLAAVCGVARSGIAPAVELAMALHLPLFTLGDRGVINPGNGYRLNGQSALREGPILVIDDSSWSGKSQAKAMKLARQAWPGRELIFAVVYLYATGKRKGAPPDLVARTTNHWHLFEWNLFNCPFLDTLAFDFDGVLCRDWPGNERGNKWREGEAYATWLLNASPLHLPRRSVVPLIVTARLEQHRVPTKAWLALHRVRAGKLIMWPGAEAERATESVAAWKAKHYRAAKKAVLFVESHDAQARIVAEASGKNVLSIETATIYHGE